MIYTSREEDEAVQKELGCSYREAEAVAVQRKVEGLLDEVAYGDLEPKEAISRLVSVVRWLYERT